MLSDAAVPTIVLGPASPTKVAASTGPAASATSSATAARITSDRFTHSSFPEVSLGRSRAPRRRTGGHYHLITGADESAVNLTLGFPRKGCHFFILSPRLSGTRLSYSVCSSAAFAYTLDLVSAYQAGVSLVSSAMRWA